MADPKKSQISARKQPQQARSSDLVAAVLDAAVQVLVRDGAQRFTMARVAEKAGASVGSLYQYFPNKAAILFRLQSDEWRETNALLRGILAETAKPPLDRLRALVHAFVRSECEEAAVRGALDDAAPLYRDAPETKQARAAGRSTFAAFMAEALPGVDEARRALITNLVTTTLSQVGKSFSEQPRTPAEIDAFAGAMADMFCAYLRTMEAA